MKVIFVIGVWLLSIGGNAQNHYGSSNSGHYEVSELSNHFALSIPFGSEGAYSNAKTHVFIDKEQLPPRCNCFRFSFLIDDRLNFKVPPIEQVMVWLTEVNGNNVLYSPKVMSLKEISTHPMSPRKSVQIIYRLQPQPDGKPATMKAKFVALRQRCSIKSDPNCSDLVIDTQGEFTGKQLQTLTPVKASDLLSIE